MPGSAQDGLRRPAGPPAAHGLRRAGHESAKRSAARPQPDRGPGRPQARSWGQVVAGQRRCCAPCSPAGPLGTPQAPGAVRRCCTGPGGALGQVWRTSMIDPMCWPSAAPPVRPKPGQARRRLASATGAAYSPSGARSEWQSGTSRTTSRDGPRWAAMGRYGLRWVPGGAQKSPVSQRVAWGRARPIQVLGALAKSWMAFPMPRPSTPAASPPPPSPCPSTAARCASRCRRARPPQPPSVRAAPGRLPAARTRRGCRGPRAEGWDGKSAGRRGPGSEQRTSCARTPAAEPSAGLPANCRAVAPP